MLTVLQGNLHTHQDMGTVCNFVKELKTADNKGSKEDWGTVAKDPDSTQAFLATWSRLDGYLFPSLGPQL